MQAGRPLAGRGESRHPRGGGLHRPGEAVPVRDNLDEHGGGLLEENNDVPQGVPGGRGNPKAYEPEVTRLVCAARCDEKAPFHVRTRKTFRKVGGRYFCEPCYKAGMEARERMRAQALRSNTK